jgi:large subunit ribosomal protein L24
MSKFKIQRDDTVVVTTGKNKGATGRVIQVLTERSSVLIEGVNLVKRQMKPVGERAGGTVEKEAEVHISNIALWNAEEGRRVKAAWGVVDGKKVRIDRKTGSVLDA